MAGWFPGSKSPGRTGSGYLRPGGPVCGYSPHRPRPPGRSSVGPAGLCCPRRRKAGRFAGAGRRPLGCRCPAEPRRRRRRAGWKAGRRPRRHGCPGLDSAGRPWPGRPRPIGSGRRKPSRGGRRRSERRRWDRRSGCPGSAGSEGGVGTGPVGYGGYGVGPGLKRPGYSPPSGQRPGNRRAGRIPHRRPRRAGRGPSGWKDPRSRIGWTGRPPAQTGRNPGYRPLGGAGLRRRPAGNRSRLRTGRHRAGAGPSPGGTRR